MTPLTPLLLVYAVPVDPAALPVPGLGGVTVTMRIVGGPSAVPGSGIQIGPR